MGFDEAALRAAVDRRWCCGAAAMGRQCCGDAGCVAAVTRLRGCCGAASMRRLRVAMLVVKVRPFGCDGAVLHCSVGNDAVRWASVSNKKGPDLLTRPAGDELLRSCCDGGCGVSMRFFGDLAVVAR